MKGPDENARYTKTNVCAISYFTIQDLHAFFPATKATGRNIFNRIECGIVKFSQKLSRIILPRDKFRGRDD